MRLLVTMLALMSVGISANAQPSMDLGALTKFARDTGMPAKAKLIGPTADYLQQQLKTDLPIFAEAVVLRKIDKRCQRVRVNYSIPDLIVTARNPANHEETRTGPFEASMELNLCD